MDFIGTMEGSEIQVELKLLRAVRRIVAATARNKWSVLRQFQDVFSGNAESWGGAASQSAVPSQSARAGNSSERRPSELSPD